ncbi:MAG: hypothetical protein AAFN50_14905 [Pseudomonadota bacterium]
MRTLVLLMVLLVAAPAHADLKSYMLMPGETMAEALDQAELGFDYHKSQGKRIMQIDSSSHRSNRRRKKEVFLSSMNGFYLTPENELLEIRKGKLVNRVQVVVKKSDP